MRALAVTIRPTSQPPSWLMRHVADSVLDHSAGAIELEDIEARFGTAAGRANSKAA
jgi:hypothetical protein